jgi:hypothetical protein
MIPWRYALPFTLATTFDEHQSCARITYHVHVVIAVLGLFVPPDTLSFSVKLNFLVTTCSFISSLTACRHFTKVEI